MDNFKKFLSRLRLFANFHKKRVLSLVGLLVLSVGILTSTIYLSQNKALTKRAVNPQVDPVCNTTCFTDNQHPFPQGSCPEGYRCAGSAQNPASGKCRNAKCPYTENCFCGPTSTPVPPPPLGDLAGVYAIMSSDAQNPALLEEVLSKPYIDGITFYVAWKTLAFRENEPINFEYIDKVLEVVKAHGKKMRLGVYSAKWAPSWLLCDNGSKPTSCKKCADSAKASTFVWTDVSNRSIVSPVSWSGIYLTRYISFIQKLGQRYNNEPYITYIAIGGPSIETGVEANMPLTNPSEIICLNTTFNFKESDFINAWATMINAFAEAFPNKDLVIALHPWVMNNHNSDTSITIGNYAKQKLGTRFHPTVFFLGDHTEGVLNCYQNCTGIFKILRYIYDSAETYVTGFQSDNPAPAYFQHQNEIEQYKDQIVNQFRRTVNAVKPLKGIYLEIYANPFVYGTYAPYFEGILQEAHNQLH